MKIDPYDAARQGRVLSNEFPLDDFERLSEVLHESAGNIKAVCEFSIRTDVLGAKKYFLHLQVDTNLAMPCVRCLDSVPVAVKIDNPIRLVGNEEAAARLDADLGDYDVVAADKIFDVAELVEDEVLMALPLMPRHTHCVSAQALVEESEESEVSETSDDLGPQDERQHPFADLASQLSPSTGNKNN